MADPLKVFISHRDSTCAACTEALGRKAWITLRSDKGALCLDCGDMGHLVFLPSGSAALTRRSKKYSSLSAIVLKWSRSRRRYERQGLLVESDALKRAEKECLEDADARARQRERAAEARAELDATYVKAFAAAIREMFPGCPKTRAKDIATHACRKHSGRVGRSAAAKALDDEAIQLAVIAHVRHRETRYDELLMSGMDRSDARRAIATDVDSVLTRWRQGG